MGGKAGAANPDQLAACVRDHHQARSDWPIRINRSSLSEWSGSEMSAARAGEAA